MQTDQYQIECTGLNASSSPWACAAPERGIAFFFWILFAIALAVVTGAHEIYLDEAQAWLHATQSQGLADLFSRFHYDGHPALWYLLLYVPARLSSNPLWMKVLNYCLSLVLAWLVLSWRSIQVPHRILLTFSVFTFFYMGVVARNYTLSGVLLVAAARSFRAGGRWHWAGVLLLSLAINTHFLAIPLSAAIFVCFYWIDANASRDCAVARFRQGQFWISVVCLVCALCLCYLTIRPAPDIYTPQYEKPGVSVAGYLGLAIGGTFHHLVPFPTGMLSPHLRHDLAPYDSPSSTATALTILFSLLALSALPTRTARIFMLACFLLWVAAVAATVRAPSAFHTSFLFMSYLVALGLTEVKPECRTWFGRRLRNKILLLGLALQVISSIIFSIQEVNQPFSGAKATAEWLQSSGLRDRPLIIQSDLVAPAVLAYLGKNSAFFPSCNCDGSVVVFRRDRDDTRLVSPAQFAALHQRWGVSPILITNAPDDPSPRELGLQLLYTSPSGWFWGIENLRVYGLPESRSKSRP